MTLHQILIMTIVMGIASLVLFVIWQIARAAYTLSMDQVEKTISAFKNTAFYRPGTSSDDTGYINPTLNAQREKCRKLSRREHLIFYIMLSIQAAALTCIILLIHYCNMAESHGAYGDFMKTETIDSVKDTSAHMFLDQSDDLPKDLSGCLLIFFKYTCNDCYDTHNQIMTVLEREQVKNIYFISSASEKGQELIQPMKVHAVPWGVYVDENGEPAISDILYDEFEKEPNKKFIEENLMKLITEQKGIKKE